MTVCGSVSVAVSVTRSLVSNPIPRHPFRTQAISGARDRVSGPAVAGQRAACSPYPKGAIMALDAGARLGPYEVVGPVGALDFAGRSSMSLPTGARLGVYEVVAPLGAGPSTMRGGGR